MPDDLQFAILDPPPRYFIRLNPPPTVSTGRLLLREVNGCGVDLLWSGSDDPVQVQDAALQTLVNHVWKMRLVPGKYKTWPPPSPIEIRPGPAAPFGSKVLRSAANNGPKLWWLCRLPPGNYRIEQRQDGGSELTVAGWY
jgi:hypothetical protein